MKKIYIVCLLLFAAVVNGYTQFFIEGNLGVSFNVNKGTGVENNESRASTLIFGVAPKMGYWLNDRMAAGVSVSYNRHNQTSRNMNNPDQEEQWVKSFSSQFGFSVFGRYQLFYIKKLSVLAESSWGINRGTTKFKQQSISEASASFTSMDINIYPVISYDLTDRISILTICEFARLGFNTGSSKYESIGAKESGSSFGLNAGSNILNSLADVRVGFIYKLNYLRLKAEGFGIG